MLIFYTQLLFKVITKKMPEANSVSGNSDSCHYGQFICVALNLIKLILITLNCLEARGLKNKELSHQVIISTSF